jgi:dipeptidyl aminopeptidase/acylaminoacyl peptidase
VCSRSSRASATCSASTATAAKELPLTVGDVALDATLTLPDESGRRPAIIGLHPASDRSRDHYLFRHLVMVLVPRGIAVLRYDRRGDDVPLELQAADARSAIAALRAHRDIDPERIGLWGFSQGAWVAPLVAAGSTDVAFLVLVASTGVSPSEQMLYGTAKHAREAGFAESAIARLVALRRTVDDWRRGRVPRERAQAAVDAESKEPWFEHAWVQRTLGDGIWPNMDFDPEPIFSRVRVPVLLFYGEDDEWQPIDASVAAWQRAARRAANKDVTIVRLPGTRHAPTLHGGDDLSAIAPAYERELVAWLDRHVRR